MKKKSTSPDLTKLLSLKLSGFEYRKEQQEMAEAVFNALRERKNLIVEAGTGVGKSLAYLIPLIYWIEEGRKKENEKRKAAVSTYTKALQRQLFEKDLPFLRSSLFPNITFAICLGSDNYLCLRRLYQSGQLGLFEDLDNNSTERVFAWAETTKKGVRSEIDISNAAWQKVGRESDLCYGRSCSYFSKCHYQRARKIERQSDILITNHHLFFANVASGYNALPSFQTAIFDEAHEIEDVAADYLGVEISNFKIKYLLDSIISKKSKGLITRLGWLAQGTIDDISSTVDTVRYNSELFFKNIMVALDGRNTLRIREKEIVTDILSDDLNFLYEMLKGVADLAKNEDERREIEALYGRAKVFKESIVLLLNHSIENAVYWAESSGKTIRLASTPINISEILGKAVFHSIESSILTSATLSTAGGFSFIRERLGLEDSMELILNSPFDFEKQAILYIPANMPEPNDRFYSDKITKEIIALLEKSPGKSMVLFTSYSLLKVVANAVEEEFYKKEKDENPVEGKKDYVFLRQGEMDNYRLIETFKRLERSILFGTYTFWQGVDFPGDELRCVIITKLPFAVPSDPVIEGRIEYIEKSGKKPFFSYQVPAAVITLRQGFGRLIRTKSDRGIVAILDSRIVKKGYGKVFLNSLPPVKMTDKVEDIEDFWTEK